MFEIAITQRLKHDNIIKFFTLDLGLNYLKLLLRLLSFKNMEITKIEVKV